MTGIDTTAESRAWAAARNVPERIEVWRPVSGYVGIYEVSNLGRVRSVTRVTSTGHHRRGKVLSPSSSTGHLFVNLFRAGASEKKYVHRLVMGAFVGPLPDGLEVCHNDGDPTNNTTGNLRYDTHSENNRDTVRHGRHPQASKTHCPSGHPYDENNTHIGADNRRRCRACGRAAQSRLRARRAARQSVKEGM